MVVIGLTNAPRGNAQADAQANAWVALEGAVNNYFLATTAKKNWEDAKGLCESRGAHLAQIDTAAEWDAVLPFVVRSADNDVWIGCREYSSNQRRGWMWGRDENNGFPGNRCSGGENALVQVFSRWAANEPSRVENTHSSAGCAAMDSASEWQWVNYECGASKNFLCEKASPTGDEAHDYEYASYGDADHYNDSTQQPTDDATIRTTTTLPTHEDQGHAGVEAFAVTFGQIGQLSANGQQSCPLAGALIGVWANAGWTADGKVYYSKPNPLDPINHPTMYMHYGSTCTRGDGSDGRDGGLLSSRWRVTLAEPPTTANSNQAEYRQCTVSLAHQAVGTATATPATSNQEWKFDCPNDDTTSASASVSIELTCPNTSYAYTDEPWRPQEE
jgi:hypothetical protein